MRSSIFSDLSHISGTAPPCKSLGFILIVPFAHLTILVTALSNLFLLVFLQRLPQAHQMVEVVVVVTVAIQDM